MAGGGTARSYPNMQPRGSQCIQLGTRPTVCSRPALKTDLASFPVKKDHMWQFNLQEAIASQAVLSPAGVGGHEEGVCLGLSPLVSDVHMCRSVGTSSHRQVGRDWGNSMV